MKPWIESLRLSVVLLAAFLTVISFQLVNHLDQVFLPTLTVVVIACATMVQNDWRDRIHDRKKEKLLASQRPNHFFAWVITMWLLTAVVVVYGWINNPRFGFLPCLAIIVGIIYSETRRIPLLPLFLTALTSSAPVLYPVFLGYSSPLLIWLFVATVVLILSREVIKDLDDVVIDRGYKVTLPILVGVSKARAMASLLITSSALIVMLVFHLWFGLIFMAVSIWYLLTNHSPRTAKHWLDVGILAVLAQLFFFLL